MTTETAKFAKKEKFDAKVLETIESIDVPPVYFWLTIENEQPVLMTGAVVWKGLRFGLSFEVSANKVQARMDSSKLLTHMREVVSVLALHGKEVLDSYDQLDINKINEQEALRYSLDPLWDQRVKAVDQLTKVKDITIEEARALKLI